MMDKSLNITNGPRQSNFELLRILAMLFVLVVHSDFSSLGAPDRLDFINAPEESISKTIFEALSIGCVNLFILISGWFGIRPSVKGFFNFIFQCAYYMIGIYLLSLIIGKAHFSITGVLECLALTSSNWFIKAYIGLYILSPILNSFARSATLKQHCVVLIAFYIFQTIFGITNAAQFIDFGYSTFSFIGLYLLANLLRRIISEPEKCAIKIQAVNRLKWGVIYLLSALCCAVTYYIFAKREISLQVFNYINPFVVIGSAALLILFSSVKIKHSKIINFISASSFAVYLLHTNPIYFRHFSSLR